MSSEGFINVGGTFYPACDELTWRVNDVNANIKFVAGTRITHVDVTSSLGCPLSAAMFSDVKSVKIARSYTHVDYRTLTSLTDIDFKVAPVNHPIIGLLPLSLRSLAINTRINDMHKITKLTNLTSLTINECVLSGFIPPTSLRTLNLTIGDTHMGGGVASLLMRLPNLTYLMLDYRIVHSPGMILHISADDIRYIAKVVIKAGPGQTVKYRYGKLTSSTGVCAEILLSSLSDITSLGTPTIFDPDVESDASVTETVINIPDTVTSFKIYSGGTTGRVYVANNLQKLHHHAQNTTAMPELITMCCSTIRKLCVSKYMESMSLCSSLTNLTIYGTNGKVDIQQLTGFLQLTKLNIWHTEIVGIESVGSLSTRLHKLTLYSNSRTLIYIPDNIRRLTLLRTLCTLNNTQLPESIGYLPNLKKLHIGMCWGGYTGGCSILPYSLCRRYDQLRLLMTISSAIPTCHPHVAPMASLAQPELYDLAKWGYTPEDAIKTIKYGRCGYDCLCGDHFAKRYANTRFAMLSGDLIEMICASARSACFAPSSIPLRGIEQGSRPSLSAARSTASPSSLSEDMHRLSAASAAAEYADD